MHFYTEKQVMKLIIIKIIPKYVKNCVFILLLPSSPVSLCIISGWHNKVKLQTHMYIPYDTDTHTDTKAC